MYLKTVLSYKTSAPNKDQSRLKYTIIDIPSYQYTFIPGGQLRLAPRQHLAPFSREHYLFTELLGQGHGGKKRLTFAFIYIIYGTLNFIYEITYAK